MPLFSIDSNAGECVSLLKEINEKAALQAQIAAGNQTITWLAKTAKNQIRDETGVKAPIIQKRMKAYKATPKKPHARLFIGIMHVPVIQMGARQLKRGVSWAGGSLGRQSSTRAFFATMRTGKTAVFERVTPETPRLPIRQVVVQIAEQTKRIMQSLGANEVPALYSTTIAAEFEKRVSNAVSKHIQKNLR